MALLRRVLKAAPEELLAGLETCNRLDLLRRTGPDEHEFIHGVVRETL